MSETAGFFLFVTSVTSVTFIAFIASNRRAAARGGAR